MRVRLKSLKCISLMKSYLSKAQRYELVTLCTALFFLISGLIIHFCCHSSLFDYHSDAIYQTILQIHATVITLALTLVTLIVNYSDSIYGIPAADFFINKKPLLFTQKVIIISSLLLLSANVVMNYFCLLQCMALYIFLASISIIVCSVFEIFPIFNGAKFSKEEIRAWIKDIFGHSNSKNKEMLLVLFQAFMANWEEQRVQQPQQYQEYLEIYDIMIEGLLKDE